TACRPRRTVLELTNGARSRNKSSAGRAASSSFLEDVSDTHIPHWSGIADLHVPYIQAARPEFQPRHLLERPQRCAHVCVVQFGVEGLPLGDEGRVGIDITALLQNLPGQISVGEESGVKLQTVRARQGLGGKKADADKGGPGLIVSGGSQRVVDRAQVEAVLN